MATGESLPSLLLTEHTAMIMKRVVILGPGASGKSTLANHLSKITGLPLTELDKLFWQPGLVATSRDQWVKIQERLVEKAEWDPRWRFGAV